MSAKHSPASGSSLGGVLPSLVVSSALAVVTALLMVCAGGVLVVSGRTGAASGTDLLAAVKRLGGHDQTQEQSGARSQKAVPAAPQPQRTTATEPPVAPVPPPAPAPSASPSSSASRTSSSAPSTERPAPQPAPQKRPSPSKSSSAPTAPLAPPSTPGTAAEKSISAYLTGYTWYDNTPAGSSAVSHPQIHRQAGGTGTYADPITVAVGHSLRSGSDVLDWAPGTRFYVPALSRYLIVEDTCGDGGTPQNGPCHTGYPASASTWLDVWIGGSGAGESVAANCADAITDVRTVIVNPGAGHPVRSGQIASAGGCSVS